MEADGIICNLNFDSGSTFIHFVEKQLEVPYRYNKGFEGDLVDSEPNRSVTFYHFVYDHDRPQHEPDFKKFHEKMKEAGLVKMVKLGKGLINVVSSRQMYFFIEEEIKRNPDLLIRGTVSEVGEW